MISSRSSSPGHLAHSSTWKAPITIGMLPPLPLERFKQVGNAAGTGARLALISKSEREKAEQIARQDGYIELAKVPNFNRKFAEATYL